jgi:hypothetical protein
MKEKRMWTMLFKQRLEPKELTILRILNARMDLSPKYLNYYSNLDKGYIGEQKFDLLIENLSGEWLTLNDIFLEFNNKFFQIDTILIFHDVIYLLDVKNFEGDYYIESDRWYSVPKIEIMNPLEQLKRSETLFRRYLQNLGFYFTIKSHLIFINPEFYLYQAPLNQPYIFPAHLNRFLNNLSRKSFKPKDRHIKLAEQLVADHILENPFMRIPKYNYHQLKKGNTCKSGNSFARGIQSDKLIYECGCEELVDSAILRTVEELRLLFPERKITTNNVYEWCNKIPSKKTIRRILSRNFSVAGKHNHIYFI